MKEFTKTPAFVLLRVLQYVTTTLSNLMCKILFTRIMQDINKYKAGYTDCVKEVARYLATPELPHLSNVAALTDPGSKARLLKHLDQCIAEIDIEICPRASLQHADSPSSSTELNSNNNKK